jgi:tetratricopeptide (TPR) repeat protein
MPATLPSAGAVESLWAEAADLRAIKSFAAAVEVYEEIGSLIPQDPEPLIAIGEVYLTQHRWPLAEDAFNRALARDGKNDAALAGLAIARWEQGDQLRAIELWETALAHRPDSTTHEVEVSKLNSTRLRLALAYLDIERPADAKAMLSQEVSFSDNPAAHLYLAMLKATKDPAGARRELVAIPEDAPPSIVSARDYLLEATTNAEAADTAADAAKLMGLAFVQVEEWHLARAALQRALALDPSDGEAMAFLGHSESQLGTPAFTHLAQAVETQPDWPLGHYLLGLYYLKQGAYEFAVEEFQTTLRLDPGNAQAMADLAGAYVNQGQYLEAEQALAFAVESAPGDMSFHKALLHLYADHALGATDRGLAAAKAATDLAPEDPEVRDMLGWMYFLAGDSARARLHLESALRLDPESASVHYHLGVLRKALGEEEAAQFALLRAIDLDTGGYYRGQAQKALREAPQLGD